MPIGMTCNCASNTFQNRAHELGSLIPTTHTTHTYTISQVMKPGAPTLFEPTHHLFGPCGGEYDRASRCYLLRYPGVTLGFAVTPEQQRLFGSAIIGDAADPHRGGHGEDNPVAPLRCGSVLSGLDAKLAPSPGPAPVRVRAVPGEGLQFEDGREALFGDSCQDVVQKLGPPCSTFRPVESAWIGGAAGDCIRCILGHCLVFVLSLSVVCAVMVASLTSRTPSLSAVPTLALLFRCYRS
jgi:hypothetical protein